MTARLASEATVPMAASEEENNREGVRESVGWSVLHGCPWRRGGTQRVDDVIRLREVAAAERVGLGVAGGAAGEDEALGGIDAPPRRAV